MNCVHALPLPQPIDAADPLLEPEWIPRQLQAQDEPAARLQIEAFARGILCNVLVCLAVWLSFAARSLTDKVFAVIFPISAFVMAGFEHSVANMYAIPVAMFAGLVESDVGLLLRNLACVTAGNVVGGGLLVGLTYWLVYIRNGEEPRPL